MFSPQLVSHPMPPHQLTTCSLQNILHQDDIDPYSTSQSHSEKNYEGLGRESSTVTLNSEVASSPPFFNNSSSRPCHHDYHHFNTLKELDTDVFNTTLPPLSLKPRATPSFSSASFTLPPISSLTSKIKTPSVRQHHLNTTTITSPPMKKKQAPLPQRFTCEYCSRKFARNHDLTRHRKIHTKEYRYKCPNCGQGFYRNDLWRRHQKTKKCSSFLNSS